MPLALTSAAAARAKALAVGHTVAHGEIIRRVEEEACFQAILEAERL
jgi:hypothetical protein